MKYSMCAALLSLFCIAAANAQTPSGDYPSRPIRLVVPFSAGGPVDILARHVGKALTERLRQPVIIENKPGAAGTLGAGQVAKAPADGYTLLMAQSDTFVHAAGLFKSLPYDPRRDLKIVAQLVGSNTVMVVRPEIAGDSLAAVLANAKSQRKPLTFGSWGPGTYPHLAAMTLARRSGAELTHIPYRGGAPSFQDFIGGQINIAFAGPAFARNLQRTTQAKLVAIAGPSRSPLLPDVPTFSELGYTDPIFLLSVWAGVAAPAGTPVEILKVLEDGLEFAMKSTDVVKYLSESGTLPMFTRSAAFKVELERQTSLVLGLIREAGVVPE